MTNHNLRIAPNCRNCQREQQCSQRRFIYTGGDRRCVATVCDDWIGDDFYELKMKELKEKTGQGNLF